MNRMILAIAVAVSVSGEGSAQGVPVIDGSNLAKNIEQLQAHLRDAENQLRQIEELKSQLEKLTQIETLLDGVLGSVSGVNEIGNLFNTAADIRSRAAKITDLSGFTDALAVGDFEGLLRSLLDGDVTMADKEAAEALKETLERAGFSKEVLEKLSSSENPHHNIVARTAATSATAEAAAQLAYEEAAQSLERIDGLVAKISEQSTLKESVDLNTRMAAETNYLLAQMWRLNAAAGLAQGQTGLNWAAEQAKQLKFFDYTGED